MQILGFLFFVAVLSLALGVIAAMLIGNRSRIVLALRGDGFSGVVGFELQPGTANVLAFRRPAQRRPRQPALLPLAA